MGDEMEKLDRDRLRGLLADNGASSQDLVRFHEFMSRRGFFGRVGAFAALAGLGAGLETALRGLFGQGLIPVAWAEDGDHPKVPGKPDMIVHNTRPINGEMPPHLLDDEVTPSERHFVRNNGLMPARAKNKDLQGWTLTVDGEVHKPLSLTMDALKRMPSVTMPLLIECAGNGRANFTPSVRGNPWDRGAIACSEWTGVPLKEILRRAGLKNSAVYTAHYGEDPPISKAAPFSRGIPIDKAMDDHTIVAYRMNGEDLTPLNGYPVRLVVPGWIGSCSQKWLNRIWVRDKVHDSYKMTGYSYRVPAYPVVPGTRPLKSDMVITTAWHIKSMITRPAADTRANIGETIKVRGHAWSGADKVQAVFISTDYGMHWKKARLKDPATRYAWYTFESEVTFDTKGYYEIWARAVDDKGNTQPAVQPWNPRGYLGNVIHRVPMLVGV